MLPTANFTNCKLAKTLDERQLIQPVISAARWITSPSGVRSSFRRFGVLLLVLTRGALLLPCWKARSSLLSIEKDLNRKIHILVCEAWASACPFQAFDCSSGYGCCHDRSFAGVNRGIACLRCMHTSGDGTSWPVVDANGFPSGMSCSWRAATTPICRGPPCINQGVFLLLVISPGSQGGNLQGGQSTPIAIHGVKEPL